MKERTLTTKVINAAVIISSLGYFVDIYDLILYGIVANPSLKSLGFSGQALLDTKTMLQQWQMGGFVVGGLIWGILGDKKGRLSVLFGSIFLYSVANIVNAFVPNIMVYAIVRFVAGVGLAGELGAGITLVNESMTKEKRGYGTMIIVSVGALGAIAASLVGMQNWKLAYLVGGGLGLMLLILRISTYESGMFEHVKKNTEVVKGNFFYLLINGKRLLKYICSICVGLPIWFIVGILILYSPELSKEIGVKPEVSAGMAVLWSYVGLSSGDLLSGALSQWLKSRKKVIYIYMAMSVAATLSYVYAHDISQHMFYFLCFALGFGTGFWALFVTMASEQFGTNIRSTVTTTAPNFVRGAVVFMLMGYKGFHTMGYSLLQSALFIGSICMVLSFLSMLYLKDTFGKDLDYVE